MMTAKRIKVTNNSLLTISKRIVILVFTVSCLVSNTITYADNTVNSEHNKKLYLIKNPENGVLRVVDDKGKTLVKTETGINEQDYDEWKRQENIFIKNIDGYNVIIKETDVNKMGNESQMYDENGNFISYVDNRYSPKSFKDGKLIYTFGSTTYEYDINKKTSNIIEGQFKSPIDNNIQYNSILPSRNETTTAEINTENISILKNVDGKLSLNSKKYGFAIDGIDAYREYERCINVKVYEVITDSFISYVNSDGRLIAEVYRSFDFNTNDYPNKTFYFVDDKYIIVSTDGREEDTYLLKYADTPSLITDVYDDYDESIWKAWDIIVFGEIIQKENNINNYQVRDIEGNKYLLCYGKNKKAYSMDGTIQNNILFDYNYTLIKKDNRCYLYNANNKLIKDDIDTFLMNNIRAERVYSELSNCIMVKSNNKFHIINQDGNIIISNLDNSIINSDVKYDSYVKTKEQFVTAKSNEKINLYDRDGRIILSNLDNYKVARSGNYFVAFVKGEKNLYNIKGEKLLKLENDTEYGYEMLNIYGQAYRVVTDANEKVSDYYSDFSKKMNTKYMCFCDINGDLCIEQNGMYNLYDINNNILLKDYKFLIRYDDKYLVYQKGFSYGLIDREGNIKCKFSIFDGASDDE